MHDAHIYARVLFMQNSKTTDSTCRATVIIVISVAQLLQFPEIIIAAIVDDTKTRIDKQIVQSHRYDYHYSYISHTVCY